MSKSAPKILLTTAHIRQWETDRERLTEEINERVSLRDKLDVKLSAARELMGELQPEDLAPVPKPRARKRAKSGGPTWPSEIVRILALAKDGVAYGGLKVILRSGPMAGRGDKGFYTAVAKLEKAGTIVRHGDKFFDPRAFKEFRARVEAGEIPDVEVDTPSKPSPMGDAIMTFMNAHPLGARSGDIVSEMLKYPQFKETVSRNRTAVYNVVKRLVDRNQIRKVGDKYYPPIKNEPPRERSRSGPYEGGVTADINPQQPTKAHEGKVM